MRGSRSSHLVKQFFYQELREQVERLEAELEDFKKGAPPVTALAPFRGRTQSWKGILLLNNSIAFFDCILLVI